MDDPPVTPAEPPPRGSGVGSILTWFGIAMVAYVLSTGPVVVCANGLPNGERLINTIYFPLIVLSDAFPPVENFFAWYCRLWGLK